MNRQNGNYTRWIFILVLSGKKNENEIQFPREKCISVSIDHSFISLILMKIIFANIHRISFASFQNCSLHGYSNVLTFQGINDEIIENVESFMRTDLMDILEKKCTRKKLDVDTDDLVHFFGVYDDDPARFKFLEGEKASIIRAAAYIKEKIEQDANCFDNILPSRFSNKDTITLPFGLFFGVDRQANITTVQKQEDPKEDLYRRLVNFFQKIEKPAVHSLSEKIIGKIVKTGTQFRADVACIFCKDAKTVSVDTFSPKNSCAAYWTLANLTSHLRKIHEIDTKHQRNKKSVKQINSNMPKSEESISSADDSVIIVETVIEPSTEKFQEDFEKQIYNQLSEQSNRISKPK